MRGPPQLPPARPRRALSTSSIVLIAVGGCAVLGLSVCAVGSAILFPVFARARETARLKTCASLVKRTTLALKLYAADYDDRLPPAARWQTRIRPSLPEAADRPFDCPSAIAGGYALDVRLDRRLLWEIAAASAQTAVFDSSRTEPEPADALQSFAPRHLGSGSEQVGNIAYLDGSVRTVPRPPGAGPAAPGGERP